MKIFLLLMKKSKFRIIAVVILGGMVGVCNITLLAVINNAIFDQTTPRWKLGLVFAAVCTASLTFRVLSDAGISLISQNLIKNLRLQLASQVLKAPLPKLEKIGMANLSAVLNEDVSTIANSLMAIPPFLINFITIGCGIIYMGYLSPSRLGIFFALLIVGVFSYKLILDLATRQLKIVRDLSDSLHNYFQVLIGGIKELKLNFSRKTAFFSEFESLVEKLRYHAVMGNAILAGTIGWGQLLILVVIGLVLFVSPSAEADVKTGFPLLIIFLMTPIESVMNTFSFIQRAGISINKIKELGVSLEESLDDIPFIIPRTVSKSLAIIEFENVEFLYQNENAEENFHLGPLNCRFQSGETVFLIGGNGSGKTTFAKLLAGLYTPDSGRILVDDTPVESDEFETYRQNFGCVFSDFFVFDKLHGIEADALELNTDKFLRDLRLSDKVKISEGVFSTTKLSQGQRKRLALLTVYLENRPIYIFDEWAADQDVSYKQYFYRKILPQMRAEGKTVFVISHDDVYYGVSDRIVKFDSGKIVSDSAAPAVPVHEFI